QKHVHHHHPQRYLLTPSWLVPGQIQGLSLALYAARVLHLSFPGRERLVPGRRARMVRRLEVDLVRPDHGRVVILEYPAEPCTFHLCHVPHQAQQRKRRRRHRLLPQLLVCKPFTLHGQGRTVVIEESSQHVAFAAKTGRSYAIVGSHRSCSSSVPVSRVSTYGPGYR